MSRLFYNQTMHFFIKGTVRLIIHAVFQVPQYMGKTYLMVCPIIIKSDIMVMDKDTLVILRNSSLYSFVPFFRAGKVQGFSVWRRTYIYITAFSVFPGVRTVCMHDRGKQHGCISSPAFRLGF